jgi:ABC-2 type transport system ATP-binding protein
MDPVIATTDLSRNLGGRRVVDGIGLAVPARSIYGFLGPNGAGKTTTIRLLLGLLKPSAGTIRIFGQPMPARRLAIARRVGALVETPGFYDHLTARENLDITRCLTGAPGIATGRVLALVDLAHDASRRVGGYSLGMKQRLGIARALIGEPDLLLLDEPTNGLDPQGIRDMRDLIRALPERANATVLVSSHMLSEVEQIATHVGLMNRGRLIFQGSLAAIGERSHDMLEIGVDNAATAARLLSARDLNIAIADDRTLNVRLPAKGAADPAAINRRLVENGIAVSRLIVRKPALEDIFMRLTADAPEARP